MATFEDRLLGEKKHYYCSSDEEEDEEEDNEQDEGFDVEQSRNVRAEEIVSQASQVSIYTVLVLLFLYYIGKFQYQLHTLIYHVWLTKDSLN